MQLLGTTALYMAMKIEEVVWKSSSKFSEYTMFAFSTHQIANKEREMVLSFNWRLNPLTLSFWVDALCNQWDLYIASHCSFPELVKRFKFLDSEQRPPT